MDALQIAQQNDRRISGNKLKSQKLDHPVCQNGVSGFPITDRVRVGFEILFV
jgi:hypothetical protein